MLLVTAQPHCQIAKSDSSDLKLHHAAYVSVCNFSGHIHAVLMAIFMQFLVSVDNKSPRYGSDSAHYYHDHELVIPT